MSPFLQLKPKHKWFSHHYQGAEDNWSGPHKTIESAVWHIWNWEGRDATAYVCQGCKTTKAEREEGFYEWEVDSTNCLEIKLSVRPRL